MYSLKFSVNYTADPGTFSGISVTTTNSQINALTSYVFSFKTNDLILANGINILII